MPHTAAASGRVELRLGSNDKDMLQLAAFSEGMSLAAFVRKVSLEAARSVVERNERMIFSREEAKRILSVNEIDLLIREGETYYPIEIKSTDSPHRGMLDNFGVLKGKTIKRGPGGIGLHLFRSKIFDRRCRRVADLGFITKSFLFGIGCYMA